MARKWASGDVGGLRLRLWENERSHGNRARTPHGRAPTAARSLAMALIYTSFTAGRDELTASSC